MLLIAITALLVSAAEAQSEPVRLESPPPEAACPERQRPIVDTRETATAIALAVVQAHGSRIPPPGGSYQMDVVDGLNEWTVFRRLQADDPTKTWEGGGLSFTIRKCDGAIDGLYRSK